MLPGVSGLIGPILPHAKFTRSNSSRVLGESSNGHIQTVVPSSFVLQKSNSNGHLRLSRLRSDWIQKRGERARQFQGCVSYILLASRHTGEQACLWQHICPHGRMCILYVSTLTHAPWPIVRTVARRMEGINQAGNPSAESSRVSVCSLYTCGELAYYQWRSGPVLRTLRNALLLTPITTCERTEPLTSSPLERVAHDKWMMGLLPMDDAVTNCYMPIKF